MQPAAGARRPGGGVPFLASRADNAGGAVIGMLSAGLDPTAIVDRAAVS